MKVAGIEVGDRPLILAPMEDVTNPPFRKFCKKYGADWLYSEFVSADALVRSVNKSLKKLTIDETERPVTIQIYGRFIDSMVEAAKIVEEVRPDLFKYPGMPDRSSSDHYAIDSIPLESLFRFLRRSNISIA